MTSDHFPIEASISMGYQLENKSAEGRVPKAWKTSIITMIQKKASSLQDLMCSQKIQKKKGRLESFSNAADKAIPYKNESKADKKNEKP
ncbi:hypothetical protein BpHYR1_048670 [Brachionus plicatilis]|uniref:RNA-directed DNA polymerase from mobile element jockey-like n=1 Tax=Brachionus plicatilis TaxID=10195 RepID=A0A3M7PRQ6_BRAPC|nr:hypothetical protein BpHYR1_048670 [Brachionus plicatilis]